MNWNMNISVVFSLKILKTVFESSSFVMFLMINIKAVGINSILGVLVFQRFIGSSGASLRLTFSVRQTNQPRMNMTQATWRFITKSLVFTKDCAWPLTIKVIKYHFCFWLFPFINWLLVLVKIWPDNGRRT